MAPLVKPVYSLRIRQSQETDSLENLARDYSRHLISNKVTTGLTGNVRPGQSPVLRGR